VAFGNGPSSGVIATASSDGTARFHDIATGLPLGPPLRHSGAILTIAFHPSGESIITGDRTGSATVWPIPR
jgi:WD40 repeat protein